MKFEEALKFLRDGKKIYHPSMETDEYLMACRISLIGDDILDKEKPISIVKMKGNLLHPDMLPKLPFLEYVDLVNKYPILKDKLLFPTINLLLLIADNWELIE